MLKLVQLALWVEGQSVHDDEHEQCCPDFSCCKPHLQAPKDERWAFLVAHMTEDYETCDRLTIGFLERAMDGYDARKQQEE